MIRRSTRSERSNPLLLESVPCRMGSNPGVDTTNFRQAIWYYIQCLFGIRHDDYNYIQINQLLSRELKHYIKTATCYPDRVEEKDYDSAMKSFKHSEKVCCPVGVPAVVGDLTGVCVWDGDFLRLLLLSSRN